MSVDVGQLGLAAMKVGACEHDCHSELETPSDLLTRYSRGKGEAIRNLRVIRRSVRAETPSTVNSSCIKSRLGESIV